MEYFNYYLKLEGLSVRDNNNKIVALHKANKRNFCLEK
jgi:hypothetical protein